MKAMDGLEKYLININKACRKPSDASVCSKPSGENYIHAKFAFVEDPVLINTFGSGMASAQSSDDIHQNGYLLKAPGYALRVRVECNDEHAISEALKRLHGDVNGLMQEILQVMANDPKFKDQQVFDFTGGMQRKTAISDLGIHAKEKGAMITYSPYADGEGHFCEPGDNKIQFYVFSPSKEVVKEMGKQIEKLGAFRVKDTLSQGIGFG